MEPSRAPGAHLATRAAVVAALVFLLLATAIPTASAASVVTHGPRDRQWVALTFDDGWHAGRCAQIASTLRKRNVTATFFPNGTYVKQNPSRWRSILKGFPVANHTMTHAWLDRLSAAGIRSEIANNEAFIEKVLGRQMLHLLRPPFGAYDAQVLSVAGSLGYRLVLWDIDSYDWSASSSSAVVANSTKGTRGSIVLLHCGPSVTPGAINGIINSYRSRGYTFVDLATMFGLKPAKPPKPAMACHVRNAMSGVVKGSLQGAVWAAKSGDKLVLRGTCRGTTSIGQKKLLVKGTQNKRSRTPTLAGMDKGTVLEVKPGGNVTIEGITVRGGAAARAAGILNRGRLILRDVVVRGNEAREAGGGIVNKGHLELRGKTSIRGNRSKGHAGGVLNRGDLTVSYGTRITNNQAATQGGGLYDRGTVSAPGCGTKIKNNTPNDCVGT